MAEVASARLRGTTTPVDSTWGLWARCPVLRLIGLFAVCSLVPLAVLTYLTIHLADGAVVKEVNSRVRITATITAELLTRQMQGVADLTASYAARPPLIEALGDGDPAQFNNDVVNQQLSQLDVARPGIAGAYLTDTRCRLTQVVPATPGVIGADFSYRDWCKGVHATGGSYVSAAYMTAILGHPLVVAVATTVRAAASGSLGKPVGILAVVYSLDATRSFASPVLGIQGIHLLITDQHGVVLVGNPSGTGASIVSAAGDPRVRQAMAGHSEVMRTTTAKGDFLSAFAPVSRIGWTVTAEIPASEALAGVRHLRSTVLAVAGFLVLVLVAGIALLARTLWQRQDAERILTERQAHTERILDATTDAFVSMDETGSIIAWNRHAVDVFGWSEVEVLGRRVSDIVIPRTSGRLTSEGLPTS